MKWAGSLCGREEEVGGLVGIIFKVGVEGVGVPFFDVAIRVEDVAFEGVHFAGPVETRAAGGADDGGAGRGIAADIAVAGEDGIGLGKIGVNAHEVAEVVVEQGGEIGGRGAEGIRLADEDGGHHEFIGQYLKLAVGEIESTGDSVAVLDEFLGAAIRHGDRHGAFAVVVVEEEVEAHADLAEIIFAPDAFGAGHGGGQRGHEHGGEDADDGDDGEKFHQSERPTLLPG